MFRLQRILSCFFIFILLFSILSLSNGTSNAAEKYDLSLLKAMKWRFIGPFRGGRVTCVTGVPAQPLVYYFGATGGGVWKSEDAGLTWNNISDGYFKMGSVGAIAVAPSDPNIVYVGMGESSLRNDISPGDGIYKSEDGGKTWKHMGLSDSKHTRRIRIHPKNPNLVYVNALGHVYGPNEERGIFRSKDGGKTWERVLFVNENTGASDLAMDTTNPRILYAGTWQVRYTPWGRYSGGPGSGVYKTTDGGDTWVELKEGLPKGPKGKVGVAVSPVKPTRVWALIEAEEGGLYRSDDGGKSWQWINSDIQLRRRHDYYTHIYADTKNADTVHVLTSPYLKSEDAGKTFKTIRVPHGDNHDLWIAPEDNQRMINSNDGGANVSFNGGRSWTDQENQPTGQMYHVIADNQFPYRVYGAVQDIGTVSVPSRGALRGAVDTYSVAGGESGYIAVDPKDSNITYGGSYWGRFSRYNLRTKERRDISPYPESPAGRPGADLKYRFNWTSPLIISPNDPDTIYLGGNVLFKSTNEGQTWKVISPDLTRDDKNKQKDGKLTHFYCTIFAIAESPLKKGLIWVGSDDGLVHITRNDGKKWENVTPKEMLEWSRVSIIEASPHDAACAYLAVNRFDMDDYKPYIYKTNDYGKSWNLITKGIAEDAYVRVVREDPKRKGLLYAGTETGVYLSFDDGENWQSLQLNLPPVPVHDLVVKEDDLVAATHGRAFWILDDITPLEQLDDEALSSKFYLFEPKVAYRAQGFNAVINYYLKEKPEAEILLEFLDKDGNVIKAIKSAKEEKKEEKIELEEEFFRGRAAPSQIPANIGLNRFEWDMRYPDAKGIKGRTYLMGGSLRGPVAVPGTYQVKITVGGESMTKPLEIKKDPRIGASQKDLQKQFDLLIQIRDRLSEAHDAVNQILELKEEIDKALKAAKGEEKLKAEAEKLMAKLNTVLNEIVELRFTGIDDQTLIYPLKLNNRIASLQGCAGFEFGPTDACYENLEELSSLLGVQLAKLKEIQETDVPAFKKLAQD